MASDKIRKILNDTASSARSELAAFFRKILLDIHMTPQKWEYLLGTFLAKYEAPSLEDSKTRSYARGNINTQFTADTMTWRTFMDALRFLNPLKVKVTFEFEWGNNVTTSHSMTMRMRHEEGEISVMDNPSANPPPSAAHSSDLGLPPHEFAAAMAREEAES